MIQLSEEGMSKAKKEQKLDFLHQLEKLWMQRKSPWRKLKVLLQGTQIMRKWNSLITETEKMFMVWTEDQSSLNVSLSQSVS